MYLSTSKRAYLNLINSSTAVGSLVYFFYGWMTASPEHLVYICTSALSYGVYCGGVCVLVNKTPSLYSFGILVGSALMMSMVSILNSLAWLSWSWKSCHANACASAEIGSLILNVVITLSCIGSASTLVHSKYDLVDGYHTLDETLPLHSSKSSTPSISSAHI